MTSYYLRSNVSVLLVRWAVACLVAGTAWLGGCDDHEIRAYRAPKEPPAAMSQRSGGSTASDSKPAAIRWSKPADWQVDTNPSAMLRAAFDAPSALGPARVTVSVLPGDAGGMLANINRWRNQLALPPVTSLKQQSMMPMVVSKTQAALVDLSGRQGSASGPETQDEKAEEDSRKRMLVVILRRPHWTWFIKMTGSHAAVENQKQAFVAFVESVRFDPSSP